MWKLTTVVLVSASLTAGCASAAGPHHARLTAQTASPSDSVLMANYLRQLPAGCRVKIERTNARVIKGRLMKVETDAILVQKDTRVPETPVRMPLREIARVEIDTGPSTGTAIALTVGATVVKGALGVLLVLAAFRGA